MTDNPPAFPITFDHVGCGEGMSLRDWFAGQVLAGFAASPHCTPNIWEDDHVARCCYEMADAMLAERAKQ